MLSQSRTLYLTGAIASFSSVRVVAGLLLALGPLFALFLLFDTTRGLFEGWVRGIAGAALGALSTSIVLGVELALMEPWLIQILELRRQNIPTPSVPTELLALTLVFAPDPAGSPDRDRDAWRRVSACRRRGARAASRWAEALRERGATAGDGRRGEQP